MLLIVVMLAGASFLALEVVAPRMLGPFFGVGPFLRAALLGLTLAAVSIGLALGGRWSDRGARPGRLAIPLFVAGAWTLIVPLSRRPLLLLLEPAGLRTDVVIVATLLFAVPWTAIAMVLIPVVRHRAASIERLGGATAGVFAAFTLAGLASALFTAFVVLPGIGVARTAIVAGLVLIAAGFLARLEDDPERPAPPVTGIALVALALLLFWRVGPGGASVADGVLASRVGDAGEVRTLAKEGARYLLVDGSIHQVVAPETWRSLHRAPGALEVTKRLVREHRRLLLLGLRGGSIAKSFARDDWTVHAVDPDTLAIQAALEQFGLERHEARLIAADPRAFVRRSDRLYDLIVVDCFASNFIPPHLASRQFFRDVEERLAPQGVVAVVVETMGWEDPLVAGLAATLATTFDSVLALPTGEPPTALGTVVLLAGNRSLDVVGELPSPYDYLGDPDRHWMVVQMNHAWANQFRPDVRGVRPWTDDWSPADLWGERINRAARLELHRFFGRRGASW